MKNILILIPAFDFGGAQRFVLNISKYLKINEYQLVVVALRRSKTNHIIEEFESNGVRCINFNGKRAFYSIFKLIRYVYKSKPDIILSTVHNIDFIAALIKCLYPKTKLIIRKASTLFKKNLRDYIFNNDNFQNFVADKIIVLTKEMEFTYINRGISKDKIVVINNMIDKDMIYTKRIEKVEHKWLNDKGILTIIANGRLVYEKAYDILIKAFISINNNHKNTRLLIVGDGILREKLVNSIPEDLKGMIEFHGYDINPYKYMYKSDIFILSSRYEGFPNVILEAFACDIPVIATKCVSGPKEIITDGWNGLLVEVDDPISLEKMIEKLVIDKELRNKLKENAKVSLESYTLNKIGKKYDDLFSGI